MIDVNAYQENIFHTKMLRKDFDLDNYPFDVREDELPPAERRRIEKHLRRASRRSTRAHRGSA